MNALWRWPRRVAIWAGPTLVLLLAVACGFLYWVIRSPAGTRWVLTTAVAQLGGQIQGVSGSLWEGVGVQALSLDMADFSLRLAGAQVRVAWPDLIEHRLHGVDVSADSVDLNLRTPARPAPDTGPFSMPVVPLAIVLDRLSVGRFALSRNGKPVPVAVNGLDGSFSLLDGKARLDLRHVDVSSQGMRVAAHGDVTLLDLRQPWPLDAHLILDLSGHGKDSPLCVRRYVPTLPAIKQTSPESGGCAATIDVKAQGTADQLAVTVAGRGQSLNLDASANLTPTGVFPLRSATIELGLADGSLLKGRFDWASQVENGVVRDHVTGSLQARKLDVKALAGASLPPAILTMSADFDARLRDHRVPQSMVLNVVFDKGSSWNRQPLSGHLKAEAAQREVVDRAPASAPSWQNLKIEGLDLDLLLGADHIKAKGALGEPRNRLDLDLRAPNLAAFWPGLPGGLSLKGVVGGDVGSHQADLVATYTPAAQKAQRGAAPHGG
ncbi:MAG TPA: DUF490 domain-containing protein, partial [Burkholderiaceae bacterium]|nr:DUF490 domain-containing protein [Burkholderiaceae bacterium]